MVKVPVKKQAHFLLSALYGLSQSITKQSHTPKKSASETKCYKDETGHLVTTQSWRKSVTFLYHTRINQHRFGKSTKGKWKALARQTRKARDMHESGQLLNPPMCKD